MPRRNAPRRRNRPVVRVLPRVGAVRRRRGEPRCASRRIFGPRSARSRNCSEDRTQPGPSRSQTLAPPTPTARASSPTARSCIARSTADCSCSGRASARAATRWVSPDRSRAPCSDRGARTPNRSGSRMVVTACSSAPSTAAAPHVSHAERHAERTRALRAGGRSRRSPRRHPVARLTRRGSAPRPALGSGPWCAPDPGSPRAGSPGSRAHPPGARGAPRPPDSAGPPPRSAMSWTSTPATVVTVSESGQCMKIGQVDDAVGPRDARSAREGHARRGADGRQRTALVGEDCSHVLVGAGVSDGAHRLHVGRHTEHERRELQGVDPQVEERATAEREIEQAMLRIEREPDAEVGVDAHDLADDAVGEQRQRAARTQAGSETRSPPSRTTHARAQRRPCAVPGPRCSANGFSHSTCFPASRKRSVSASWRECGDATYTTSTSASGGERFVGRVTVRDVELGAELLGPFCGTRRDGDSLRVVGLREPCREPLGDATGRHDPPPDADHPSRVSGTPSRSSLTSWSSRSNPSPGCARTTGSGRSARSAAMPPAGRVGTASSSTFAAASAALDLGILVEAPGLGPEDQVGAHAAAREVPHAVGVLGAVRVGVEVAHAVATPASSSSFTR